MSQMMQCATAFTGGFCVRQCVDDLKLPQFRLAAGQRDSFKLSVHVHAASVPALAQPGRMTRERPRVEVTLNDIQKETEPGDFVGDGPSAGSLALYGCDSGCGGVDCPPCPWQFGDTLTFVARVSDVKGPGLQLLLRSSSDFVIGPVQVVLAQSRDLGVCNLDLQRFVLPACAAAMRRSELESGLSTSFYGADGLGGAGQPVWETPVLAVPLARVAVSGGITSTFTLGQAAAHVALSFRMNTDPEAILRSVDSADRPLVEKVTTPIYTCLDTPSFVCGCDHTLREAPPEPSAQPIGLHDGTEPIWPVSSAAPLLLSDSPTIFSASRLRTSRAMARAPEDPGVALSPDLAPDGWVKHVGENHRVFWHHLSLGPPPWLSPDWRQPCSEVSVCDGPATVSTPPVHGAASRPPVSQGELDRALRGIENIPGGHWKTGPLASGSFDHASVITLQRGGFPKGFQPSATRLVRGGLLREAPKLAADG